MNYFSITAAWFAGLLLFPLAIHSTAKAEDQISIVGSSTVFPFSTTVAERFGKKTGKPTPAVESTGSGGGFKRFCTGVGENTPDITNASRAIKASEIELCAKNGVNEIVEAKIGYDGIVLANSKQSEAMNITRKQIFTGLAKRIPDENGALVANPYKHWSDIDASLPNSPIKVLGPPPTSGTRDAFVELVMEEACDEFPAIKALKQANKDEHKRVCAEIREDGAYVEMGENDNLIIQKLNADKASFGIFGFSFLDQNSAHVQASAIEGNEATFENIADGAYPVSRPLFFYVKKAHVGKTDGIEAFLAEFTHEGTWGEDGYLLDKGLIPLGDDERKIWHKKINELVTLN